MGYTEASTGGFAVRALLILALPLLTVGCGMPPLFATVPGEELPWAGPAMCTTAGPGGLCRKWSPGSGICVNPQGPYANPPTLPCEQLRQPGPTAG